VRRKKGHATSSLRYRRHNTSACLGGLRAYQLYLNSGKATLAAMYLRRVRVVGRAAVGSITRIDGFYLVSIQVDAASICENKNKRVWKRGRERMASIPPRITWVS
jgi:hypothetical protein